MTERTAAEAAREKADDYYVENRITKEARNAEASSAAEACEKCGWMIGDCYVRKLHFRWREGAEHES